jgi:hypothetical protein
MIETASQTRNKRLIDMLAESAKQLKAEGDELRAAESEARSVGEAEAIADRRRLIRLELRDLRESFEALRKQI